jgi:hypothetical protein
VVSAPVLFFLANDQGSQFAAVAAAATLSAVLAVFLFALGYAWTATRTHWVLSLVAGLLGYFAAVGILSLVGPPAWVSAPVVYAAVAAAPRAFPALSAAPAAPVSGYGELAMRMAAGAALVVAVTHCASDLGPRLSGLFAMFPVLGSVLAVFSHRHAGAPFAISLLRGMTVGYYAFTSFCLVLAFSLPRLTIGAAFTLALAVATLVQVLARRYVQR